MIRSCHKKFRCQIGIPYEDIESNDSVIFGFMVAIFLQHFVQSVNGYRILAIAHFHEWQAGKIFSYFGLPIK